MCDLNVLYVQMACLTESQLAELQRFINSQPYKREGRAPTPAERDRVIAAIKGAIAEAPSYEEQNPGLQKLRDAGYLDA